MPKYKQYDLSFRNQAIKLALSSEQLISKTAKDVGVFEPTLYNWISKTKNKGSISETPKDLDLNKLHDELFKLRKENQRLKATCDALKKTTAYFVKET